MPNYPPEQLWTLYHDLPKDLQEALFAETSARNINSACAKSKVTDNDTIFQITKQVGYVLLGLLAPDGLAATLEEEPGLDKNTSEQIAGQINNLIFLPVKNSLEALYKIKITESPESSGNNSSPAQTIPQPPNKKTTGKDLYREPIE
jgi:hypothetical protein